MDKRQRSIDPVSIFCSYAPEDEQFLHQLEKHLSPLRREGLILNWHAGKISAGTESIQSITSHLNTASIILLLISPDFMMSDRCYGVEMSRALERQTQGQASVISILVRPVDWQSAPFAHLQCLPHNQRPVTLWPDRDAAFAEIVQVIRTQVESQNGNVTTSRLSFVKQATSILTSQQEQNRQRFLKRVRDTWISGVLERSLYNATLITLGLHEQPAAVANPWHLIVQETDGPTCPQQDGTRIIQVYDGADGALLILGEPGAGKTTLLLELARDLIERAEHNSRHALPAVFNLSAWASKHQPLSAWLVEELHDKYNVPRKLGEAWIEHEQLLPLLDGLDEVVPEQRSACIAAINQYRQEHHLTSLIVCCRSAEYLTQDTRLALYKSIIVQPLTAQQIDDYLSSAGEQLAAVRVALQADEGLREMAAQPLMLNILTLTYQDMAPDDLLAIKSPTMLRQQIFNRYVERMLQRRGATSRYTQQQTRDWLRYLAKQMKLHGQTEFYIERIKSDWLGNRQSPKLYHAVIALICTLIGITIGFISSLSFGLTTELVILPGFGLIGLITGLAGPQIRPTESFHWSWTIVRQQLFIILGFTLIGYLVGWLGTIQSNDILISTIVGTLFGALTGTLIGILNSGLNGELARIMPDTHHILIPNQEIRRSAYFSLLVAFVSILFCFLFSILSKPGILIDSVLGLVGTLTIGGLACIQHFVLRVLLWRSGALPWNLPRFLDYAAERILLRKVGGGYIFIHRLLLEYFTQLDDNAHMRVVEEE